MLLVLGYLPRCSPRGASFLAFASAGAPFVRHFFDRLCDGENKQGASKTRLCFEGSASLVYNQSAASSGHASLKRRTLTWIAETSPSIYWQSDALSQPLRLSQAWAMLR